MRRVRCYFSYSGVARLFAAALLVWALDRHPYGYYTLLRWVVCGVGAYSVFVAHRNRQIGWAWCFGVLAVLFNPIVPIQMDRDTWAMVDLAAAIVLVISIFSVQESRVDHILGLKPNGSIVAWGNNDHGQCDVPAPNTGFVAVAAGGDHSLGLKANGSIVTWGYNCFGQCDVPCWPNAGFVAVAAGTGHSLGLKANGSIVAWGNNDFNQCDVPAPNTGFVAVAAHFICSFGLKGDGSIVEWGFDDTLGLSMAGEFKQCDVPAPNTGFVAVAGGDSHGLGLKADGSIVAWGENYFGQCDVPAPNTGFVAVVGGKGYSMGLKADGSIVAWGSNRDGQCDVPAPNTGFVAVAGGKGYSMGLKADGSIVEWGSFGNYDVPAPNAGFVAVSFRGWCSLGLKADGSIVAWGNNDHGQCDVPAPNTGFVAVAAGGDHSLGLKADGSIVAWGSNGFGRCGVPTPNTGFVAVAAGQHHSLGLKADGSIVAWGSGCFGKYDMPAPNAGFVAVAVCGLCSLGLKADGSIVAWGTTDSGRCDVPAPNAGFVSVAGGDLHSLGLKADGSIVAWGTTDSGRCDVPTPNTGFVAVAAGQHHSLSLKADGSIVAWGSNGSGQCDVPAPNTGFVAVAVRGWYSLGLKADGSIVAWGNNDHGQCDVPAPNTGFVAVASGGCHSLAIRRADHPSTCNLPSIQSGQQPIKQQNPTGGEGNAGRETIVPDSVNRDIRNAWTASLVVATITLAFIVTVSLSRDLALILPVSLSKWNLVDVAVALGLAYGIYRRSRVCAVAQLVSFICEKIAMYSEAKASVNGIGLVLIYFFFRGVLGTFRYHRIARRGPPVNQRRSKGAGANLSETGESPSADHRLPQGEKRFHEMRILVPALAILLSVQLALSVLGAAFRISEMDLLARITQREYSQDYLTEIMAEATDSDRRIRIVTLASIAWWIPLFFVALPFWVSRANKNARFLGAAGMKFTPGWSVAYWYIPILNLYRPFQVMSELWRTGEPLGSGEDRESWKRLNAPMIIWAWWGSWLVSIVIASYGGHLFGEAQTQSISYLERMNGLTRASRIIFWAFSLSACSEALWLWVVLSIHCRQMRKYKLLMASRQGVPSDGYLSVQDGIRREKANVLPETSEILRDEKTIEEGCGPLPNVKIVEVEPGVRVYWEKNPSTGKWTLAHVAIWTGHPNREDIIDRLYPKIGTETTEEPGIKS